MMSRRRVVTAAGLVITLLVVEVAVIVSRPEPPLAEKLANSLVEAGDGFIAVGPCERHTATRWRCVIEDDPGSGASDAYRLDLDTDGCWAGARTMDGPGDQPLSGCIEQ